MYTNTCSHVSQTLLQDTRFELSGTGDDITVGLKSQSMTRQIQTTTSKNGMTIRDAMQAKISKSNLNSDAFVFSTMSIASAN